MELKEFISSVLQNIDNGFCEAKSKTSKSYHVQNDGVTFDVAVTTSNNSEATASGKIGAGIIQVLGAGVSGEIKEMSGKNEVSRIKFTVYVPSQTDEEIKTVYANAPHRAIDIG